MRNPFRYFNSSPEVIRLVVMMYIRYPLSLRPQESPRVSWSVRCLSRDQASHAASRVLYVPPTAGDEVDVSMRDRLTSNLAAVHSNVEAHHGAICRQDRLPHCIQQ